MKRIALICEVLHPPLDEGVRILAAEIGRALSRRADVTLMGERETEVLGLPVRGVVNDRYFLGSDLARALSSARPDAILYIPWTSLTARTFLRVLILRKRAPGVPVGVVALQPRGAGPFARALCRFGRPDRLFATGPAVGGEASAFDIPLTRLEGGVDLERFRPRGAESPSDLRRALSLPVSPYLVLHAGHLKASRGIMAMKSIQAIPGVQALVIASTSTSADADAAARRELQDAGVRVIDHHLPDIDAFYRASDCYLFPVTSALDAIELPLSILEAMATNLPIVTTRFGGVQALLEGAGPGVAFASSAGEFPALVSQFMRDRPVPALRERVRPLSWDAMAERILESLESEARRPSLGIAEARG